MPTIQHESSPRFSLLSRDDFRNQVFARDEHKCVICGEIAADAHHIIERRLFSNGGYYLENGASLCETHHKLAESTELTCEQIRTAAGIVTIVLPEDMYPDTRYDKWGNPFYADSEDRLRGPLYFDDSVRRILKGSFRPYVKYPRTYHLPWSAGRTKDDRGMPDVNCFLGKEIVITEKMDGENTTMYRDYIHARSIEYGSHPSRNLVKALHARICGEIPFNWRICGENVYAKHSIEYGDLESYFLIFSIWNERNECLSWAETTEWANLLQIPIVPVILEGFRPSSASQLEAISIDVWGNKLPYDHESEGYVVRLADEFLLKDFTRSIGKYVRKDHIASSNHWRYNAIIPNKLRGSADAT